MQLASTKPIAILTCNGFEGEKHLDLLLIEKLKLRGIVAESIVWQEENDWTLYRAALIRSTWDYSLSRATRDSFLLVLKKIVDAGAKLFNSLPLVRWNSEKTYLRALFERGIYVIETLWLSKAQLPSLEAELSKRGWTKCVIKPVISASAMHTRCFVLGDSNAVACEFAELEPEEWMVQPFAAEITEEGEWSLVFINNAYQYSVLKRPAPGNFLVQHEQGGRYQKIEIEAPYVLQAKTALQTCCDIVGDKGVLYARMDGVRRNGKFVIMEAELIEPSLFSEITPEVADVLLDVMLPQC